LSDLRDRILALNGEAGSRREALEMAAQLADAESAAVREEVDFQRNIVRGLYGLMDEGNRRTARWISKAINAENALNEANKLLEQTIEVLEERFSGRDCISWTEVAPLLDNLKARKS
jgi:hypothetical protein